MELSRFLSLLPESNDAPPETPSLEEAIMHFLLPSTIDKSRATMISREDLKCFFSWWSKGVADLGGAAEFVVGFDAGRNRKR